VGLLGMEESLVDGGNGVEQLVALDLVPDSLGSNINDFWFRFIDAKLKGLQSRDGYKIC
jgi:hypothetical protein